ncbi:MAG: CopG family transcriptional regulator [Deltaproteobacteria bacterium]|nr:CopG family transcriptional regulator [Deltaproteobacteria bacterium]
MVFKKQEMKFCTLRAFLTSSDTHDIHNLRGDLMTRVQILLEEKEVKALRRQAQESGKSYSQLVREAIDTVYTSRFSQSEIAHMAKEAKLGKGVKTFKDSKSFLKYLWSL